MENNGRDGYPDYTEVLLKVNPFERLFPALDKITFTRDGFELSSSILTEVIILCAVLYSRARCASSSEGLIASQTPETACL